MQSAKEMSPQRAGAHTVQRVVYGHKVSTSLAMEIILEPFDLLGFYTNEGKILWFKPLVVTGTLGLGPEVMTDGEGCLLSCPCTH